MNRAPLLVLAGLSLWAQSDLPPDENPRFFPPHIFAVGYSDGDFTARWYAKVLRALEEPSLLDASAAETVYRFTCIPTWTQPIAIRITTKRGAPSTLLIKMMSGQGGYDVGHIVKNEERDLPAAQRDRVLALITKMNFWKMPTEEWHPRSVVLDGTAWILEASDHGTYHVVDRTSPTQGAFWHLGHYLVQTLGRIPNAGL